MINNQVHQICAFYQVQRFHLNLWGKKVFIQNKILQFCIKNHIFNLQVDKSNPKKTLIIGLSFSTLCVFMISISRIFGSKNIYLYCFFQILYGFFDSICLPSFLSLFCNWYSKLNRGKIKYITIKQKNIRFDNLVMDRLKKFRRYYRLFNGRIIYNKIRKFLVNNLNIFINICICDLCFSSAFFICIS
ncbi:major facilitator superfamily protein, putative [Ichthyophthirius multifiliis]|uniref:Major facilitator superfamily protein, putative n=1 Tax=Ichthyophthirius multifiliis TaxID=5932 RepID=G0QU76_ICHMU|nr:major facilitator superfamily protein, putative [Ichthyophthirius multifiliis]EGR31234.1 major facilitator superfamily protein, putative [Ichthyophthirius multifiliis]|eukprot:XP_004034720.1 major facilitator superfamily protein, putative [Ichthyophthirius multifiliis]